MTVQAWRYSLRCRRNVLAVSNRTCDAPCIAAQEENDAKYTHRRHAKNDVAWPTAAISQNWMKMTMSQRSSIRHSPHRRPSPSPSLNPSLALLVSTIPRQPHRLTHLRPCPSICPRRRPHHTLPSRRQLIYRSLTNELACATPTRTGIVVPPHALSHLPTSPSPSDDSTSQIMQQQSMRQGFCWRP